MSTCVFVIQKINDKKLLIRKSCQLHFALSVTCLTLSHNCQEKFSRQWGLLNNWWNGARRLFTVEKEEVSTFQAAFLATTVPLTCLQNYIASKISKQASNVYLLTQVGKTGSY